MLEPEGDPPRIPRGLAGLPLGVLVFGFGLAAGFLAAFSGIGFLEDSAGPVIAAFLVALALVALVGAVVVLFRHRLMRGIFGIAEAQIDQFGQPLSKVADAAIARDPAAASAAARDLVRLVVARYAWIATRRWLVASLIALIAAMAALAGTALLFKQNQLLAAQSVLLAEQNARIDDQTRLLRQDVELAEAARNAELAVTITEIGADLGALADAAMEAAETDGGPVSDDPTVRLIRVLDPATDLTGSMILRIVSASRALRPYRFLDSGIRAGDDADKLQRAMLRRRAALPETYARMEEGLRWPAPQEVSALVDRPASPERGALFQIMVQAGLRQMELLNHFGLDMNFAFLADSTLLMVSVQGGRLAYADFSGAQLNSCDFGGAWIENSRFRRAVIRNSSFATVSGDRARPPLDPGFSYTTQMAGADFDRAVIVDTSFAGSNALATTFEGATLLRPDFTGASLGAASFRGVVLVAPVWDGAELKSVDFEGAILFGADALDRLAAAAAPESFVAANWRVEEIGMDEVMAVDTAYLNFSAEEIAEAAGNLPPVRLHRAGEPLR